MTGHTTYQPVPTAWPPPRDHPGAWAMLEHIRARDPVGHLVHTSFGMLYAAMLPLTTAGASIAFIILFIYTLLRIPTTWRCYPMLLRTPLMWAIVAWIGWHVTSINWSETPAQGWDEARAFRVLLAPLMLWPVLDRVAWLVGAALAGVVMQNMVQASQALGWIAVDVDDHQRLRGLLQPIQTGAWCAAALCWHTTAFLRSPPRWKIVFAVLGVLAAVGLVATGSRGPWIGAALATPLALGYTALRDPRSRRLALVVALVAVVAGVAGWPVGRRIVQPRIEAAWSEVRDARENGVYWESTSLRLGLWSWAISALREAPLVGHGAGSFRVVMTEQEGYRQAAERKPKRAEWMIRDHCHSTWLQVLSMTGLVGLGILAAFMVVLARQLITDRRDHVFADAAPAILLLWMVGAQFDCYELNGHTLGLLGLLAALTLPLRPHTAPGWGAWEHGWREQVEAEASHDPGSASP